MADKKTTQLKTEIPAQKLVVAHARSLRIAPRKLRLVANSVKLMRVSDALVHLQFLNKKGAEIVSKLIKSAAANAEHNFSYDTDGLVIQSITCDAGPVMKRYMPRARGSASPLNRRMSHLHVTLEYKASTAKKVGRFGRLLARSKPAAAKPETTDAAVTSDIPEVVRKADAPKTNEQIKQGKVQQKRRLFNRRTGE